VNPDANPDAYRDFIARKSRVVNAEPVPMADDGIAEHLFPHQRDLVGWALRRGRAAIFADCGMGKTAIQLEWARHCAEHGRVLILAPLAVGEQTVAEGARFGVAVEYAREDTGARITITNYEMLHAFNPAAFVAVVIDESSRLKDATGKQRTQIIEAFAATRWRLACTATPAPNDFTELGNHSQFLGVKSHVEMLSEYFVHDGGDTSVWRLKGHAEQEFWRWVCSWGAVVKRPSDLGHSDEGYALPELRRHDHVISVDHKTAQAAGMLFADEVRSLSDQRATRRATTADRIAKVLELTKAAPWAKKGRKTNNTPVLIWCELNTEQDAIAEALAEAGVSIVSIDGSMSNEDKIACHAEWLSGKVQAMATKMSIFGHGLNWQHCWTMIFVGVSHSFEQTYQGLRRCWRFGQTHPVDVHVIRAETEGAIVENLRRKGEDAERLAGEMVARVGAMMREEITGAKREWDIYRPSEIVMPSWLTSGAS
jgi:hypothetical protein